MTDRPQPTRWDERAGARLMCTDWQRHMNEPYHGALLIALMMEFRDVSIVIGFDGFIYDPREVSAGRDQLCTLSLWAVARRGDDYAAANCAHAHTRAPSFIGTWVAGWTAAMAAKP